MTAVRRAPRVTYLITSSSIAGAQRQVHDIASSLRTRGWQVSIVSMLPIEGAFADLQADGTPVASLDMRRGIPDPRALLRLRQLLREWKPDILHGHMVHANLLARFSRLLVNTPVVISTMHNQNEGPQWRYLVYRITDPLSEMTTTVSKLAVEEAIRRHAVPRSKVRLIYNGIDSASYAWPRDMAVRRNAREALDVGDRFMWLAVGRLDVEKDVPNMLAAFRLVHQRAQAARLYIAGTGPLEAEIRHGISQAGLAGHVVLLGLRSDVPALMQAADGYLLSSAWEGLPMVLLEAGASGLPIVATDVGGTRDAVIDGVSGYVAPARHPEALADAAVELMGRTASEREAMGRAGREHVVRAFDLQAVASEWHDLYRQLLSNRRRLVVS
jgi:glycosyltransferase involved in cell wall biosynthesis